VPLPSFYTTAGNFVYAVQGGVDPRTGLFNISLPLVNLRAGNLAGPVLALSLNYSPLSLRNEGFGKGFALNLTRYDVLTRTLHLSTGEEYLISSNGTSVRQHKFRNFIFEKTDDDSYLITHKSGLVERIIRYNSEFVTTLITTPNMRSMFFDWDASPTLPARLIKVRDVAGVVLCAVTYVSNTPVATTFTVLPDNAESGYNIQFSFQSNNLLSVTTHVDKTPLVWRFSYDDISLGAGNYIITGRSLPTGQKERVEYNYRGGMAFPDGISLPALPCVSRHTLMPGEGQLSVVTQWEWTKENYLGKNASRIRWLWDADPLLDTLLPEYRYGSTAKTLAADGITVLSSIARRYNSYHLLISERQLRDGKLYQRIMKYYARSGSFFNEQPEQYLLLCSLTELWGEGESIRKSATYWQFDKEGNMLREEIQDGTIKEHVYYHPGGERGCPADPHGFTRYLKSTTIKPKSLKGDEPTIESIHTWQQLGSTDNYSVVPARVVETTGNMQIDVNWTYYSILEDSLTFGREKKRTTILTPDVKVGKSWTRRQKFSYEITPEGFRQSEELIAYDGLTATHSTLRHASLGHLLSETDAQGVTVTYTYDKLGRVLTRADAAGTSYERLTRWVYASEESGPVIQETDPRGNQMKTFFDGMGRKIKLERLNRDGTPKWYEVWSQTYSVLDETTSGSCSDWITTSSQRCCVSVTMSHDGWGNIKEQEYSDGIKNQLTIDPIKLTRVYGSEGKALSTGTVTTELDSRNLLPLTVTRKNTAGQIQGICSYEWDGLGCLRLATDELNKKTTWTYDTLGRVLTQTLPDETVLIQTYAPHLTGNQVAAISIKGPDGQGKTQTWNLGTQQFDGLGRLTERVSGGRTTSYSYSSASPLPDTVTLPSGKKITYVYIPELGNAVSELIADGVTKTFNYDATTGQIVAAREGGSEINNTLHSSGSVKTETFSLNGIIRNTAYTRTLGGESVAYTDISGKEIRYERDEFGRVTTITDDALTASLQYNALGQLNKQVVMDHAMLSTLSTQLVYDDFGREISRTIIDSSGDTLCVAQTWSNNDLLNTRNTQRNGTTVREELYDYDTRNRLAEYKVTGSSLPQDGYGQYITGQTYLFNAINNIITVTTKLKDGKVDTAMHHYDNAADPTQLTSVTHTHSGYPQTISLKYDTNGSMTKDELGRLLGYDATGRLVSLSMEGMSNVGYVYDALDRLVCQNIGDADSRQLYYRQDELVNEVLTRNNKVIRLIKHDQACLGMSEGNTLTLTADDHHNSLLWSRNTNLAQGRQYCWTPYGSGNTIGLMPKFNGERSDPVSGVYHLGNGYRSYNPVLMCFNCPDNLSPFGAGGINPYAYCAGDPVNFTDPTGHISGWGIAGIVLGSIGLLLTIGAVGMSIAAAEGIMAALSTASTTSLVIGGLGVLADVTAVASGATEDSNPEASAIMGWASLASSGGQLLTGLGKAGLRAYRAAGMQGGRLTLGGTMKNLDSMGQDIYFFDDIYKGAKRLNIVAHGALQTDGTALLARTSVANMNANELFTLLSSRVNITKYQNIRTIMCHSGSGGARSFGQQLANLTRMPVKSYRGTVMGNFAVNDLNKFLYEAAGKYGDEGMNYIRVLFAQKHTFRIDKVNPYSPLSLEQYLSWNFDRVKFYPL
jgi:RHS repeat-associated protein